MDKKTKKLVFDLTEHIISEKHKKFEQLMSEYADIIEVKSYVRLYDIIQLEGLLDAVYYEINLHENGFNYFIRTDEGSAIGYNQDFDCLVSFLEAEVNRESIKSKDEVIKKPWLVSTIMLNAYRLFEREVISVYENLKKDHYDEFSSYFLSQTNKRHPKKLKWTGSLRQLGYVFAKLTEYDYIERPKLPNGNDDLNTFAEILLETFDIKGSKDSLKAQLGRKVEESHESFMRVTEKYFEKNNLKIEKIPKDLIYIPYRHDF